MKISPYLALLVFAWLGREPAWSQSTSHLDVTFFVTGDTHVCTERDGVTLQVAKDHVLAMNTATSEGVRGKQVWPQTLPSAGQRIQKPQGVVITGDISTDMVSAAAGEVFKGSNDEISYAGCWQLVQELYSGWPNYKRSWSLRFPSYPGFGNHDWADHSCYGPSGNGLRPWCGDYTFAANKSNRIIANFIAETVKGRITRLHWQRTAGDLDLASSPPLYSWDWGQLHLVNLETWAGEPYRKVMDVGLHPGDYSDNGGWKWLEEDLKAHTDRYGQKAPIIIFQHYGYDAQSTSGNSRGYNKVLWPAADRDRFEQIIKPYNVIVFFTGHDHGYDHRTFGDGGRFLNVSTGNGTSGLSSGNPAAGFWAVHVTDSYVEMAYLFKKMKQPMDGETYTDPSAAIVRRITTK